jgi:hypothetical protein
MRAAICAGVSDTAQIGTGDLARQRIDRGKLRAAIRREGNECIFHMLDVAIELIPQPKLLKLIARYLNPAELYVDNERKPELLAAVEAFQKASLAGKYHQAFAANSKNFMAYLQRHARLDSRLPPPSRPVHNSGERKEGLATVRAFEIIFSLLDQVDAGDDDILFFVDEGGSWAARNRLGEGAASLVQDSLRDGRSRRVRATSTRNELTRS